MTIPRITVEQILAIQPELTNTTVVAECNRCNALIDAYNKTNEQPLISAEEARNLGAENAEFLAGNGLWFPCMESVAYLDRFLDNNEVIKYRAIKQPEPLTKTEKKLAGALEKIFVPVEPAQEAAQEPIDLALARAMCRGAGISLVSRDFIERFADFVMDWKKGDFTLPKYAEIDMQSCFDAWQAFDPDLAIAPPVDPHAADRTKPAKVVLLADVPLGVAVVVKEDKRVGRVISVLVDKISTISIEVIFGGGDTEAEIEAFFEDDLELAPASAQPWIAAQDDQNREELILDFGKAGLCYEFDVYRYKITGLAEGYVLEGAKPTGVLTK